MPFIRLSNDDKDLLQCPTDFSRHVLYVDFVAQVWNDALMVFVCPSQYYNSDML